MRQLLPLLFWILLCFTARAQYFDSGQDPASIRWMQIKTEHFNVIFPDYYEKKAQYFSNVLDSVIPHVKYKNEETPSKIRILLHPETSWSNGFVTWAPKRMELFTTSPSDVYSQDYLSLLAKHEYRHVTQIDQMKEGVNSVLKYIFGEQIVGGTGAALIPFWFIEGDAVVLETALSASGRGRIPSFLYPLKAQTLKYGLYSYDKAMYGSYRDFTPDHYSLGYQLAMKGGEAFGYEKWDSIVERIPKRFSLRPFSKGIKNAYGKPVNRFYEDMMEESTEEWRLKTKIIEETDFILISPFNNEYSSYFCPNITKNGNIIALKESFSSPKKLVEISANGKEEKLFIPGRLPENIFKLSNNKIFWTEINSDPRWENRSNVDIYEMDYVTGKKKTIVKNSRLFMPAVSEDGSKLAAVEMAKDGKQALIIKNLVNERPDSKYQMDEFTDILTPAWLSDSTIICIIRDKDGKHFRLFNTESKTHRKLWESVFTEIANPVGSGSTVYFNGAFTGRDEIYELNVKNEEVSLLTQSRFGARNPSLSHDGNKLLYSYYTADGYKPAIAKLEKLNPKPLQSVEKEANNFDDYNISIKDSAINIDPRDIREYPDERYRKLPHLFNFHSWAPVFVDPGQREVSTGISLLSQNLLSTSFVELGYNADSRYSNEKYKLRYSYKGLYPIFEIEAKLGDQRITFPEGIYLDKGDTVSFGASNLFNNYSISLNTTLPFDFSKHSFFRKIFLTGGYEWIHREEVQYTRDIYTLRNRQLVYKETQQSIYADQLDVGALSYRFYIYNLKRSAIRDIQTPFGQILDLQYKHTPFGKIKLGTISAINTTLYFPSLFKNHSIRIENGFQKKLKGDISYENNDTLRYYRFSSLLNSPRGYGSIANDQMYSFSADYTMPLIYPDLNVGAFAYFKRVYGRFFYDYSYSKFYVFARENNQIRKTTFKGQFQSYGVELNTNVHLLRFILPFDLGVRYGYMPEIEDSFFEFLFTIDASF